MAPTLSPEINPLTYTSSRKHQLLSEHALRPEGANIGRHGEHLTITFLAFNRSHLTERLCRSIAEHLPSFSGEVLAVDNGSTPEEFERLEKIVGGLQCRSRVVRLDRNYGVAGGRNRTMEHVRTDWVMCLDNDIYFTQNPIEKIQNDLAVLGCKFANMPLLEPDGETLFSLGGHLYLGLDKEGCLRLGHGGAYPPAKLDARQFAPQLSTFLFGGASILEKRAFFSLGRYDENMFVGFEDTDFSVRLFRAGLKVGTIGIFSLIHEHPVSSDDRSVAYKSERYSPTAIEHSARYMEKKHGFSFWNDELQDWIKSKHDIGGDEQAIDVAAGGERIKIALVADVDNWAFANIARQVKRALSHEFDIDILYFSYFNNELQLLFALDGYDLIHFFWRPDLRRVLVGTELSHAKMLGSESYKGLVERKLGRAALTTSVYDHLFLSDREIASFQDTFASVDAYSVSSLKLRDIYGQIKAYQPPAAVLQDGVDLHHFRPGNLQRFHADDQRALVIGWAGNSAWKPSEDGVDYKGLHSIVRPALEMIRSRGGKVVENFADRNVRFRSYDEMPDYYSTIDIYLCASLIEGTPNPVLEAMACGVPVVATDVGIVREVFGPLQSKYILSERSPAAMADAIYGLYENRDMLRALSEENLRSIVSWDWSTRASAFLPFFRSALRHRASRR